MVNVMTNCALHRCGVSSEKWSRAEDHQLSPCVHALDQGVTKPTKPKPWLLDNHVTTNVLCAGPVYLQEDAQGPRTTSSHTHQKVDAEITRMLREAYSRVTSLLVSLAVL